MYKKNLINLCAVTLAMSIAFAPVVTVCAEDSYTPETWTETPGEAIEHNGNVQNNSSQWSTVYSEREGNIVIENGNATNLSDEWRAVGAFLDGTAIVNGNASGGNGGTASSEGTAVVTGNVTGRTDDGIQTNGDSYFGVGGNVKAAKDGIETDGSSTAIVEGNVKAGTNGINIVITKDTCTEDNNRGSAENLIVVEGTVTSSTGVSVKLNATRDESGEFGSLNTDDIPTIIVYELNSDTPIVAQSKNSDNVYSNDEALTDFVKNNIQYIVKNNSESNITIIGGLNKTVITKVDSATIDQKMTDTEKSQWSVQTSQIDLLTTTLRNAFTVAVKEGYELSAGDNVSMVRNEDGTYTITMTNGKGGITLSARLIKVAAPAVSVDPKESNDSGETFDPFIVATFTVTNSSLPDVLGATRGGEANEVVDYASRPVVRIAGGPLSAFEYKSTFIRTMKEAPKNAIVRLETSIPSCFDKMMMEALDERDDIILELAFPVEGKKTETSVPAGYDVMTLLDENGYCGFLNLLAVFGNSAK